MQVPQGPSVPRTLRWFTVKVKPSPTALMENAEFEGVPSTLALHRALVADAGVMAGDYHTNYLESWMQQREGTQ